MQIEHSFHMGAFSYGVSGYYFAARIGRYCSFGEDVQVGRQDHAKGWISTSPAFYLKQKLLNVGSSFQGSDEYHKYSPPDDLPIATRPLVTTIGHDVWIGHGSYIKAGVTVGTGAMVAAHSVVVKDVPPYSLVAGNPAQIKRLRFPVEMVSRMLNSRWWRFAPWQLQQFNVADPQDFLREFIGAAKNLELYQPEIVSPEGL
jgi:chloramphenicol O-acetyltransferase type B